MKRATKIVITLSGILGLSIGAFRGAAWGRLHSDTTVMTNIAACELALNNFAAWQTRYADVDHARQASLLDIKILMDCYRLTGDPSIANRLSIAYTRLGIVEESAGKAVAGKKAIDEARKWLIKGHPQQVEAADKITTEHLKDWVLRMDAFDRTHPL